MFQNLLNFYSKYPWVSLVILMQWLATAFIIITSIGSDPTTILGISFFSTIIYSYIGFKIPKA